MVSDNLLAQLPHRALTDDSFVPVEASMSLTGAAVLDTLTEIFAPTDSISSARLNLRAVTTEDLAALITDLVNSQLNITGGGATPLSYSTLSDSFGVVLVDTAVVLNRLRGTDLGETFTPSDVLGALLTHRVVGGESVAAVIADFVTSQLLTVGQLMYSPSDSVVISDAIVGLFRYRAPFADSVEITDSPLGLLRQRYTSLTDSITFSDVVAGVTVLRGLLTDSPALLESLAALQKIRATFGEDFAAVLDALLTSQLVEIAGATPLSFLFGEDFSPSESLLALYKRFTTFSEDANFTSDSATGALSLRYPLISDTTNLLEDSASLIFPLTGKPADEILLTESFAALQTILGELTIDLSSVISDLLSLLFVRVGEALHLDVAVSDALHYGASVLDALHYGAAVLDVLHYGVVVADDYVG